MELVEHVACVTKNRNTCPELNIPAWTPGRRCEYNIKVGLLKKSGECVHRFQLIVYVAHTGDFITRRGDIKFYNIWEIYSIAKKLLASHDGLCFPEILKYYKGTSQILRNARLKLHFQFEFL